MMLASAGSTGISVLGGALGAAALTALSQIVLARYNRRQSDAQAEVNEAAAERTAVGTATDIIDILRVEVDRLHAEVKETRAEAIVVRVESNDCRKKVALLEQRVWLLERFIRQQGFEPPE